MTRSCRTTSRGSSHSDRGRRDAARQLVARLPGVDRRGQALDARAFTTGSPIRDVVPELRPRVAEDRSRARTARHTAARKCSSCVRRRDRQGHRGARARRRARRARTTAASLLCAGDDRTDEDMFRALRAAPAAVTVTVRVGDTTRRRDIDAEFHRGPTPKRDAGAARAVLLLRDAVVASGGSAALLAASSPAAASPAFAPPWRASQPASPALVLRRRLWSRRRRLGSSARSASAPSCRRRSAGGGFAAVRRGRAFARGDGRRWTDRPANGGIARPRRPRAAGFGFADRRLLRGDLRRGRTRLLRSPAACRAPPRLRESACPPSSGVICPRLTMYCTRSRALSMAKPAIPAPALMTSFIAAATLRPGFLADQLRALGHLGDGVAHVGAAMAGRGAVRTRRSGAVGWRTRRACAAESGTAACPPYE